MFKKDASVLNMIKHYKKINKPLLERLFHPSNFCLFILINQNPVISLKRQHKTFSQGMGPQPAFQAPP